MGAVCGGVTHRAANVLAGHTSNGQGMRLGIEHELRQRQQLRFVREQQPQISA